METFEVYTSNGDALAYPLLSKHQMVRLIYVELIGGSEAGFIQFKNGREINFSCHGTNDSNELTGCYMLKRPRDFMAWFHFVPKTENPAMERYHKMTKGLKDESKRND